MVKRWWDDGSQLCTGHRVKMKPKIEIMCPECMLVLDISVDLAEFPCPCGNIIRVEDGRRLWMETQFNNLGKLGDKINPEMYKKLTDIVKNRRKP